MEIQAQNILAFWYGAWPYDAEMAMKQASIWFSSSDETDQTIRERFLPQVEAALNHSLVLDESDLGHQLAFILLTDQFTRNIFRGNAQAFSGDDMALNACFKLIDSKQHTSVPVQVAGFMCMPLQHSESLSVQQTSIAVFNEIAIKAAPNDKSAADNYIKYAQLHHDIIKQFGRFPHRNQALGRLSTPEESEYLNNGAHRFGQ